MKTLLAACLLLAAAPLRAQVYAPVTDDEEPASGPQAITGAGVRASAQDTAPSAAKKRGASSGAPTETAAGGGGGAGAAPADTPAAPAVSGWPPAKITHVAAYDNIPAMPEHQGAHGLVRLSGPGQVVAIGFTAYSVEELKKVPGGAGASSGGCLLNFGPNAAPDPSCDLFVWISEKPGGPPLSDSCHWRSYIISNVTIGGHFFSALPGHQPTGKDAKGLCFTPKNGQRYYCNVMSTGWDKPEPPKKCDATLNFPMTTMPQDVYPDSFPK